MVGEYGSHLVGNRCRANVARMKQSRPDSGIGCQVKVLSTFQVVTSSIGSGRLTSLGVRRSLRRASIPFANSCREREIVMSTLNKTAPAPHMPYLLTSYESAGMSPLPPAQSVRKHFVKAATKGTVSGTGRLPVSAFDQLGI